jgi:hypothetical protein
MSSTSSSGSQTGERDLHLAAAAEAHEVRTDAAFHFRHCRVFANAEAAYIGFACGAKSRCYFRRKFEVLRERVARRREYGAGRDDNFQAHVIVPFLFCMIVLNHAGTVEKRQNSISATVNRKDQL